MTLTDNEDVGFWKSFYQSLKTKFSTWLIGIVIALLGVFSGHITENIKFSLNKADSRSKHYEELATDFSQYLFRAEIMHEFLGKNWTTKPTLESLVTEYNNALRTVRKKEYVYLSWVERFWDSKDVSVFKSAMGSVRAFDDIIHTLNDELEAINILETKERMSDDAAKQASDKLRPILEKMKTEVQWMLTTYI